MRLLQRIDRSFIGKYIAKKQEIIANTNPDRIYIENIRSFFNISFRLARFFCELAVREGVLRKKRGIICFNHECGKIILSIDESAEIPPVVNCHTCQLRESDTYQFNTEQLDTIVFYQLIRKDGK